VAGQAAPSHHRLFRSTLQRNPILLRTSCDSGHGFGTALTETMNQEVDVFAFCSSSSE
jgi:prolyl oligopeptidase PreP (S9A serine peptidase family)